MIEVEALSKIVAGKSILSSVSLSMRTGEMVGILGPNGAGKSTLLRCILGLTPPTAGRVLVGGRDLAILSRRESARQMAFVPQSHDSELDFTVADLIAMGRTPHLGRFRPFSQQDRTAIGAAVAATRTESMLERTYKTLSGGERQRVLLARALAQATPALLLDEPTANLDPFHELVALRTLADLAKKGNAVVAVLHDLNLASRFCDRIALLAAGRLVAFGTAAEAISEASLREVFRVVVPVRTDATTGRPAVDNFHAFPIGT